MSLCTTRSTITVSNGNSNSSTINKAILNRAAAVIVVNMVLRCQFLVTKINNKINSAANFRQ